MAQKQRGMLLLFLTLLGASGEHISFPERATDALERCCAHADGCDELDCRLYREFRDNYRYEALETQCREPLLYALWPPHRAHSVRFDCLAPEHFLTRLQHDINTSEAQATVDAKEVQFLCIVDPRAIAHPQYRDTERVLANGSRVHEPCATTYLRGADVDVLWRYLRAEAAPAAFSEIHVRAPRRYSGVRAQCADGSRSLLTLNAAEAVRRLLPELGRRQRSTLRVIAHVYGVDARAHCVLCEYIDGVPRVKMKKFETSVRVYPYHRRVTEPQRRAPPWARRDRLRARDSLWCAGYRALLALHRPQIVLEGGVRYRPRRARRCHVLALGGARVIKLVLGDTAQLARLRLPAYALHVQLRWAATPARWKPESVSVVRVGAAMGTRRRLTRARWLPRRRAYYARALTLRVPAGHYLTIDALGVEYFEDGTPERFSRSIDGKLDTDEDLIEELAEIDLTIPKKRHPYHIIKNSYNDLTTLTRTTLSQEKKLDKFSTVSKSSTKPKNLKKFTCVTIKEKSSEAKSDLKNPTISNNNTLNFESSGTTTNIDNLSTFAKVKEDVIPTRTTNANKLNIDITKVNEFITLTTIKKDIKDAQLTDKHKLSVQIANVNKRRKENDVKLKDEYKLRSPKIMCVTTNTKKTTDSTKSLARLHGYLNIYPQITSKADTSSSQAKNTYKPRQTAFSKIPCVQMTHTAKSTTNVFFKSVARLYNYFNISPEITTQAETSTSHTRDTYKPIQITSPETTCVKVMNMGKTTTTVSFNTLARISGYFNKSNVMFARDGKASSKSGKTDMTVWKVILIVAAIILLLVLAGIVAVCLARYGVSSCCGNKQQKEAQDPGSSGVAAATAATRTEAEEGEAGGPLDVVVQSLVVAQGVTIALAARILWHLWNVNHGAATVTTGAGVKVP